MLDEQGDQSQQVYFFDEDAGMQVMPTHADDIRAMHAQPSTRPQAFQGSSVSALMGRETLG